ncbi:hypothetical protein [Paenibacillus nasutitermitis]|uniref:Uncharacterized protein n=1 Tax=Paenibacillus nasutitermitis TaxID=1652958 RepID=A0A916ZDR2_9BACL|nr:hypothetical protein [Paenibacillus nasutitermitis]GGD88285.1 hypothetical protein GCM10010911_53520 [Paenibacillus nasutitermitis]
MSVANALLNQIKSFLDGSTDPWEFSFDFPSELVETHEELEKENSRLCNLLNDDMPEICSYFEPEENARSQMPEYLDEDQFKAKVTEVYMEALRLV